MSSSSSKAAAMDATASIDQRVTDLLAGMTVAEKIGQMCQVNASEGYPPDYLGDAIRQGAIGAVINQADVNVVNELQRIAVEESRLGIPLLVGRDVIHGFRSIMPIPLGQAATWNPELVRRGAAAAAREAAAAGINWSFAPMIDIARDPRWGRIAESFGEDVYLTQAMAVAMIQGYQGDDLAAPAAIAACAKHFAGYGAVEGGRDYAATNVPENELRNVHLPPFKAAVDAGVQTLMTSFSDIDGVPGTANAFLLRQVLREEWGYGGFVVSDWDSVHQLQIHGLTENDYESACEAVTAGVDMEMAGNTYAANLQALLEAGRIDLATIDQAVARILRVKFQLGLFAAPYTDPATVNASDGPDPLQIARELAQQSVVLLKNEQGLLPLQPGIKSLAVIGPLADAAYEQLGTWIFDGDVGLSVTPLAALREEFGEQLDIRYVRAMENSRSSASAAFAEAAEAARGADVALLFLGEESILSGEAHCRADIDLPGDQEQLVKCIRETGTPLVGVIMAGRPLTLSKVIDEFDALLYAWHPGAMGGPAIVDLLFGRESPSGKLPVSFPRVVGQIPIHYSRKNTGKPPSPEAIAHIDDIDTHAPQTSLGMSSFHLDAGYKPLYPFGFGLSYADFEYHDIDVSTAELRLGESLTISASVTNHGAMAADEVVQLYIRDLVGSVTRPVRQLAGFQRVRLQPQQTLRVSFDLHSDELAFYGRDQKLKTEPGLFHAWIGGNSEAQLRAEFRVVGD